MSMPEDRIGSNGLVFFLKPEGESAVKRRDPLLHSVKRIVTMLALHAACWNTISHADVVMTECNVEGIQVCVGEAASGVNINPELYAMSFKACKLAFELDQLLVELHPEYSGRMRISGGARFAQGGKAFSCRYGSEIIGSVPNSQHRLAYGANALDLVFEGVPQDVVYSIFELSSYKDGYWKPYADGHYHIQPYWKFQLAAMYPDVSTLSMVAESEK